MPDTPVQVGIVPHTHWDREWYAPFQTYRVELVHLLDELLDLLERDDTYARFLLDGQTAVLDDYLEVRPAAEARLAALVAEGRVQIGPWMVLMDEYMVSAETIVRDLQLGIARARALGGAMNVGYLPDMFGHVAQMPQILRLAGLEHAVVWRGVPSDITRTAFWWEAPDGSRVRAEYLFGSYSNGRDIPNDWTQLVARARGYELELGDARLAGGGMLLMNGSDHLLPQPWLGRVVDDANRAQAGLPVHRDVVARVPRGTTDRSRCPNGAASCGRAHAPTCSWGWRRTASTCIRPRHVPNEPSSASVSRSARCSSPPRSTPTPCSVSRGATSCSTARTTRRARAVTTKSSKRCGCGTRKHATSVKRSRTTRTRALATEVDAPPGSTIVVNPTQSARGGLVAIPVPGEGPVHMVAVDGSPCPDAAHLAHHGRRPLHHCDRPEDPVGGRDDARARARGRQDRPRRATRTRRRHGRVHAAQRGPGEAPIDLEATREELLALGDAGTTICIRQRKAPVREVVFAADAVPGFGWRSYRIEQGDGPATAVRAEGWSLANEHVQVDVDPHDGTLAIAVDGLRVEGANRYVDGGDGGDTYNYSPPADDTTVDRPVSVQAEVLERGPVRARMLVIATYEWPTHAIGDERSCASRSDDTVTTDVRTTLELRTDERFLRVRVEFDNRARDHRLRAHFPLPARVDGSSVECAFAVVQRGLTAEGGPHEFGLPTFVSRRFVDASDGDVGLALVHDGLLEYEVLDGGRELALTLLRATGYLSRSEMVLRPNPAGPLDALRGPQLQEPLVARLRDRPAPRRLAGRRPLRRRRRGARAPRSRPGRRLARRVPAGNGLPARRRGHPRLRRHARRGRRRAHRAGVQRITRAVGRTSRTRR